MEGPYRDLGSGFARLTGVEGVRRSPSRINTVEDALLELLRNAREAGAQNIYVASSLSGRRYRTLTVIDDGHGIPEAYKDLVFEPGVTIRHLDPGSRSGGAGLSLYHIKNATRNAAFFSTAHPTSITVSFDTHAVPERSLQSATRTSRSNLLATVRTFLSEETAEGEVKIYYASPAVITATLVENRVIPTQSANARQLKDASARLGLDISSRTVQRIVRGEIKAARSTAPAGPPPNKPEEIARTNWEEYGLGQLKLTDEEKSKIAAILGEAARTRYLEVGDLKVESRPGEIVLRSRVYEPEEEYE